jgi:group I intron endonuclease
MIGFVYKWIDTSNGMYYIGSHKGTVDDGYIGSGTYFSSAFNKRPNSFVREILYVGPHYRELEEFILEELDAANDKLSYNLKNSAIGGSTRKGMKNSKEHIRKSAESNKGKTLSVKTKDKISKETKKKLSLMRKGDKNAFYGKKHTLETKKKMSESKKGDYIGDEKMSLLWNANKKSVYCMHLDKTFDSVKECAEALGISPSSVSNMIAGRVGNKYGLKRLL